MAAKAPAKTAEQIAAEAKQKAVNEITKAAPGLANPERYVTAKNTANILGAREAYIKENLKLDPTPFKAGNYNIAAANKLVPQVNKFKEMGLANAESFIGKNLEFNASKAEESLIKDVYKLNPAEYKSAPKTVADTTKPKVFDRTTGKYDFPKVTIQNYDIARATQKYQFEQPKIAKQAEPKNFAQAVNNYSNALSSIRNVGAENINEADYASISQAAKTLRDFDSKTLGEDAKQIIANSNQAIDAINEIRSQRKLTQAQEQRIAKSPSGPQRQAERGKFFEEEKKLQRLIDAANQNTPKYIESFARYGLSDLVQGIGGRAADLKAVDTGLEGLRGKGFFDPQKSDFFGRVNSEVTDEQILNDINTQSKAEAKRLYDIGTAATTDLQSQITQANQFLSDLPANDPRRASTQKQIDALNTDLAEAQKDTLEAKNLFENYQPVSGAQATSALSKFRESLRLPEERTLKQIDEIDPTVGATVRALSKEYQTMVETPLAPTTNPETEAFRRDVEQRIAAQVALGSQLGAEEQRQYQQAARAAQTARGNIFGVAPAVEEAVTTGLAGEQRLQARLGAAQGFLASGQSMTDAAARDVGLRNALTQSRLGAAQGFIASGPTMYNLASQRLGTQQGLLNNYLAASAPQATGGFQATPSAANPYAYVNPNAGFLGAQNAAGIYNTLANYQEGVYGSQVGAISRQPSGAQNFAQIAGGISSLLSPLKFG
jgi:hypothetical protein